MRKWIAAIGVLFVLVAAVGAMRFSAADGELPGVAMSLTEAAEIRAAVTARGDCVQGGACVGTGITCALTGDQSGCVDSTSACGTCNGANDVNCVFDVTPPITPYSCENALPKAHCCNLTTACRWRRGADGSAQCNCVTVNAFSVAQVTRIVC